MIEYGIMAVGSVLKKMETMLTVKTDKMKRNDKMLVVFSNFIFFNSITKL